MLQRGSAKAGVVPKLVPDDQSNCKDGHKTAMNRNHYKRRRTGRRSWVAQHHKVPNWSKWSGERVERFGGAARYLGGAWRPWHKTKRVPVSEMLIQPTSGTQKRGGNRGRRWHDPVSWTSTRDGSVGAHWGASVRTDGPACILHSSNRKKGRFSIRNVQRMEGESATVTPQGETGGGGRTRVSPPFACCLRVAPCASRGKVCVCQPGLARSPLLSETQRRHLLHGTDWNSNSAFPCHRCSHTKTAKNGSNTQPAG